jgi:glucose/arabinose dehydrogenase
MKKFFKRSLLILLSIVILLAISPFALIQFGPESKATGAKLLLNTLFGYGIEAPSSEVMQQRLTVPIGFSVNVFAQQLGKIRFLKSTAGGDLIVTRPRAGDVLLLRDEDGDGVAETQQVLLADLNKPHGIDIADGWLYIAESTAIGKVAFDQQAGKIIGTYQRIVEGLADSGNHWSKTLGIGPDGYLYFTSGSSCNVCEETDPQRAAMMRVQTDGSSLEIYATGLRNAVGFDWSPWDQALYATDNGRDLLGDDFPPCELNKIEHGGFYGWPYINGFAELDPDLGPDLGARKGALLASAISPVHGFRAHNAPLGIRFLRHNSQPEYQRSALAALHGSWNRSERDGYKVVSLHWQDNGDIVERDFFTGFKSSSDVIGRPVDIAEAEDGSIYVSDDYTGTIYRIIYGAKNHELAAPPVVAKQMTSDSDAMQYSDEQTAQLQLLGEAAYTEFDCGSCHDTDRASELQSIKPLAQLSQRYSSQQLADFFLTPTPPMPLFALSQQQREALAVYLISRE